MRRGAAAPCGKSCMTLVGRMMRFSQIVPTAQLNQARKLHSKGINREKGIYLWKDAIESYLSRKGRLSLERCHRKLSERLVSHCYIYIELVEEQSSFKSMWCTVVGLRTVVCIAVAKGVVQRVSDDVSSRHHC